jgi:hypothetical protein
MKFTSSFIGSAICGAMAFAIWPEMWKSYGIMGGWITATIVISIAWYMNHWIGIIYNPESKLWIDQGWGVGTAGITWALVRWQGGFDALLSCVPTLVLCLIGGGLAGIVASHVKRKHHAFTAPQETPDTDDAAA